MWDYLFPFFCLGCKKEGNIVCETCLHSLSLGGVFVCPVCHIERNGGVPCVNCKKNCFISSHIALGIFDEQTLLGKLISSYKYDFIRESLSYFEIFLEIFLKEKKQYFEHIDIVVPIPLHKRRLAQRGFNQAEEIACLVAKYMQKETKNILTRKFFTQQQAKLDKTQRLKNVENVFFLKNNIDIKNKNILLVDDVFTTGATMGECARILMQQGALTIHGFTLARG